MANKTKIVRKRAPKIISPGKKDGRPSKKDTICLKQLQKLAIHGLTDVQIADVLDINVDTLIEYKKSDSNFSETIKKGKAISDAKVERSLFDRANGYTHPEEKVFLQNGKSVIVKSTKYHPPETLACIFWLKNRKPKEWRDRREVEIGENTLATLFGGIKD